MKQSINQSACLLIVISIMGARLCAQSPLPDPLLESPSAAHEYYENQGQIIDELGLLHPEIKYYTNDASPQLYLADERISFVTWARGDTSQNPNAQDTSYRIDLVFPNCIQEEGECPALVAEENGDDHLNYYLAHCPAGITDVAGHNRIIYKGVADYTDMHFYSNVAGLKSYIVFHPGADPSSFYLHFQGQDSIQVLPGGSGGIDIYLGPWDMEFPQATAYAIDPGGIAYTLPWLPVWVHNGLGEIGVSLGTYDPMHTLVLRIGAGHVATPPIQNLTWSTYYGGNAQVDAIDIVVNDKDEPFHLMDIEGSNILPFQGEQIINGGWEDVFISKFNSQAEREWATFFGGTGQELPQDMVLSDSFVFITGQSSDNSGQSDLPVFQSGNGFYQDIKNGHSDAFLLEIDQADGFRQWATYFGGAEKESAYGIDVNVAANMLVIVGRTNSIGATTCDDSTKFPLCANSPAYFQTTLGGSDDGFVAQFDLGDKKLIWSSFFGGTGREIIYDVLIGNPEANNKAPIYICGKSFLSFSVPANTTPPLSPPTNGDFPLTASPSSTAYFQIHAGSSNNKAFVARFDSDRRLQWSTFFGGGGSGSSSEFHRMALNFAGDLYVVGNATAPQATTSCSADAIGRLPICNGNGVSDTWTSAGRSDALITRFDASGKLLWSTLYGSSLSDCPFFKFGTRIALDSRENVYITGTNGGQFRTPINQAIPTKNVPGAYYQSANASLTPPVDPVFSGDAFLLMFTSDNKLKWATHFGGDCACTTSTPNFSIVGDESAAGISIYKDQRLYLTGTSRSPTTPYQCPAGSNPFCNPNLSSWRLKRSAYISRFELSYLTTAIDKGEIINMLTVFPNPAQDELNIQLPKSIRGSVEIQLYDQVGRKIRQEDRQAKTEVLKITVEDLSTGVYYLILTSNNQRYVAKWIK